MWSKQCIIYAADRTRSENSQKRANRCRMAGSLEGKKKENEKEGCGEETDQQTVEE